MAQTFAIAVSRSPEELVAAAREKARAKGAFFEGDAACGRFAARGVEGTYVFDGGSVTVTIEKKPTIAPWSLIEAEVRGFFG